MKKKKKSTKRKTSFYFDRKYFKMDRRAEIQKILTILLTTFL